jgi:hypothetical protein
VAGDFAAAGVEPTPVNCLRRNVMKEEVRHEGDHEPLVHHRRPRHLAEKFEGYIGMAMVAALVVLGIILVYGLMKTGTTTPSWMR